jgi:hypothetical protein
MRRNNRLPDLERVENGLIPLEIVCLPDADAQATIAESAFLAMPFDAKVRLQPLRQI